MIRFILKRLLQMILILLAASLLIFLLVRAAPADPVRSMTRGKKISAQTREALEKQYHLDEPLYRQYLIWIRDALKGDFGDSYQKKMPVRDLIAARLPTTLQIVLMSAVMALCIAIPAGIFGAVKMNTGADRLLSVITLLFSASPVFLTGIILILVFALQLHLFPSYGAGKGFRENLYYLFLPSLALSLNMVALIARITRTCMIEQLGSGYAKAAAARGISRPRIVLGHCLKNALIPVITVASVQIGTMIVGAVLVENVFALGGIGEALIASVKSADYPVVQGITLMLVAVFAVINLVVDIIYALIDPRIRL